MEKIEKLSQTKVVKKLCAFCEKPLFAVALGAFLVVGYCLNVPVFSIGVFALIASFCFLFAEDSRPALTVILLAVFSLRGKDQGASYLTVFAIVVYVLAVPPLLFSLWYRLTKHRVPLKSKKGLLCIGLLCFANLFGGVFSEYYTLKAFGYGISFSAVAFFSYLIFACTLKKREDNFLYFARVAAVVVGVIIIQVVELYIREYEWGTPMDTAWKSAVVLGWGLSNLVAEMTVFLFPAIFYLIYKEKRGWLYWILIALALVAICLTMGRNALIWAAVCTLVGAGINCFGGVNKKASRIIVLTVASLCVVAFIGLLALGKLSALSQINVSDSGRLEIWKLHLQFFMQSPINGVGFQAYATVPEAFVTYAHNAPIQFISSTGIVGTAMYAIYRVYTLRLIFKKLTIERVFIGGCIVAGIMMSLLSPLFFLPYFVMYNCILQLFLERSYEE